jgi:hypothetical protein
MLANKWTHIAMTLSTEKFNIYKDGRSVYESDVTDNLVDPATLRDTHWLGKSKSTA